MPPLNVQQTSEQQENIFPTPSLEVVSYPNPLPGLILAILSLEANLLNI
jgi:hypothetical protein